MEPVFRTLEVAAEVAVTVTGIAITFRGLGNIPRAGGAVIAINQTSYVDSFRRHSPRNGATGACGS